MTQISTIIILRELLSRLGDISQDDVFSSIDEQAVHGLYTTLNECNEQYTDVIHQRMENEQ